MIDTDDNGHFGDMAEIVSSIDSNRLSWNAQRVNYFSIYTLCDFGVFSNLIGSLSLANEHYSPLPSE